MDKAHGIKIKHRLERNGSSFSAVARKLAVTPQAVHRVAYLLTPSRRIINQLSEDTGWPISKIWPNPKGYSKSTKASYQKIMTSSKHEGYNATELPPHDEE
jgi:hypothetical protein